jgi:hypothetical protein
LKVFVYNCTELSRNFYRFSAAPQGTEQSWLGNKGLERNRHHWMYSREIICCNRRIIFGPRRWKREIHPTTCWPFAKSHGSTQRYPRSTQGKYWPPPELHTSCWRNSVEQPLDVVNYYKFD